MIICIYAIVNTVNDKKCIGSTKNFKRRCIDHRSALRHKRHCNSHLQNAWNKHGEDNFQFIIIENCKLDELIEKEGYWIEKLQTHKREFGYNICRYPRASRLGCKARPETIEKMRISNGGKNHPNWGKKMSKKWIANMKRAVTGIPKPNSGIKKKYLIINPNGIIIEICGLRKFCRENNLNQTAFFKVANGQQYEHRGWKSIHNVKKKKCGFSPRMVIATCEGKEFVFQSLSEAKRSNIFDNPVYPNNIVNCCKGRVKHCGRINGILVSWKYLD